MTGTAAGRSLATRFAFRLGLVYVALTILAGPMLGALVPWPDVDVPPLVSLAPLRGLVTWVARRVFGIEGLVVAETGSGDRAFDWVAAFCILTVAAGAAAVWTVRTLLAERGGAAPRSPLHGIWDVDGMSLDGRVLPPLLTDAERWRRVVVDSRSRVLFQRMDDTLVRFVSALDESGRLLSLTKPGDGAWRGSLAVEGPAAGRLVFDGTMGGKRVHLELRQVDPGSFLLVSRGFHWVQERPFNP